MGLATILGVIILGVVLAWGYWQYSTRNKRADPATDAASRATYEDDGPPGGRPS